jgi:hypothetical protein
MESPAEIDTCASLYLDGIVEPEANSLSATVLEAKQAVSSIMSFPEAPVPNAVPIVHVSGCRIFDVMWSSYIAYSVRNERFAHYGTDKFEGRLFRVFSKSHFLDYVAASTIAGSDYPGPYKHWQIVCADHILDVVSIVGPAVNVRIAG